MRVINLVLDSFLPPDLRNPNRELSKRAVDTLLADVARKYPDQYADIVQKIADLGRKNAYMQGESLTLQDLYPVVDKDGYLAAMDMELDAVSQAGGSAAEQHQKKLQIWSKYADVLEKETKTQAIAKKNNLGAAVISGARGNPFQLKAMITTPALYTDYKDEPVPIFVRNSFAEGLRPAEYLASTFGVRKSVISTKNATAEAGDYGKQAVQMAAAQVVTTEDCGTHNGIDIDPDSPGLIGRVLARDQGDFKAGAAVDKEESMGLRKQFKGKRVLVRSPLTCQAKQGVCSKCLGLLPEGKFAPLGYAAGITAVQSYSEPLTQGALNTKHGGGGFSGKKRVFGGFDVINQISQSPEVFPNRAAVAELDGQVESVTDAPQGGKLVQIGDKSHYVLPGFSVNVKPGDSVEAGDILSEGIADVYDILRTRGLGEARRYYAERLAQAAEDSGLARPSDINMEMMARAAIDNVQIEDPDGLGEFLPDDIASYNKLSSTYSPPRTTRLLSPKDAVGKFLQGPALHYSIGTRITPKIAQRLQETGMDQLAVDDEEPKFKPTMLRMRALSQPGEDWLAKLHSSYLSTNLANDAARARDTNIETNTHFAPRLMVGENFGKKLNQTGKF